MKDFPKSRTATILTLVLVTLAATALACVWAVRVPFFQRPDELAHSDYAFTLLDVGHLYVARDAVPSYVPVAPQLPFLERAAGYRSMRFNPFARAPKHYATGAFIAAVDAGAPRGTSIGIRTTPGSPMPYVMFSYPCGYYIAVAAVLHVAQRLDGGSLWWTFMAARLFNAALLLATLPLAFGAFRESGLRARTALLATAAIGFFPLVEWISAYVQPDNASFLLLTLCLYLAERIRRRGVAVGSAASLAFALGALLLVKQHYGVAAWLPAFAVVLTRQARTAPRSYVAAIALLGAVPAFCLALSLRATPIVRAQPVSTAVAVGRQIPGRPGIARLAGNYIAGIGDAYVRGAGFDDYWLYDVRDLRLFGRPVARTLLPVFGFASFVVMTVFIVAMVRSARRLARIARYRSPLIALRLCASGVALHCYLLGTFVILSAYAIEDRALWLEGRYWYPLIVPLWVVLLRFLPTLARANGRARIAQITVTALLVLSAALTPVALAAMQHDYYGAPERQPRVDRLAAVTRMAGGTLAGSDGRTVSLEAGHALTFEGYAVDLMSGLPARRIVVELDGKPIAHARTGARAAMLRRVYNDGALERAGFHLQLTTVGWTPGDHAVSFLVASDSGITIPFPNAVRIVIHPVERRAGVASRHSGYVARGTAIPAPSL